MLRTSAASVENEVQRIRCRAGASVRESPSSTTETMEQDCREDAMRATKAVFFMHKDRPVARLLIGAVLEKRPGLRAFLMLMLGASLLCATAMGAAAPNGKSADTQAKAAASSRLCGQRDLRYLPRRSGQEVRRQPPHQDGRRCTAAMGQPARTATEPARRTWMAAGMSPRFSILPSTRRRKWTRSA